MTQMQVADCYIHVQYRRLTGEEFDNLKEELEIVARDLASIVKRGQDVEFVFEEGTLLQRILIVGRLVIGTLDFLSHHHDLRESVIDMAHDSEAFSNKAIEKFHQLTHTTPNQDIYKRTSSRDVNWLHRIINSFDQAIDGDISPSELPHVRSQVIHDLAGLARANPGDPEIANIFTLLPKDRIPALPSYPLEAISIDEIEFGHKTPSFEEPDI
jgi:hypothetical protein